MSDLLKATMALMDFTRIRVLNLLLERECCVCEVMQSLDITQSKASHNLSILYQVGFLKLMENDLWSLYSVDREGKYFDHMIKVVKKAQVDNEVLVSDIERLKVAKRVGVEKVQKLAAQGCGFCTVCKPSCPQYKFRAEIMQEGNK
jgi:ArsR family transcriptional regulator